MGDSDETSEFDPPTLRDKWRETDTGPDLRSIVGSGSTRRPQKRPDRTAALVLGVAGAATLLIVLGVYAAVRLTREEPKPAVAVAPKTAEPPAPDESEEAEPEPAAKPAPEPEIEPVDFQIQGLRVGDQYTIDWINSHCPDSRTAQIDTHIDCIDSVSIEGRDIQIRYFFDKSRLLTVSLRFDPAAFDSVVRAYTEKFHTPPHRQWTAEFKTRGGASYENETVLWETNSGDFTIARYGGSSDAGIALLHSPEYRRYLEERDADKVKAIKDKL